MQRSIFLLSGLVVAGLVGIVGDKLWQSLMPAQALTFQGWPQKCQEIKQELGDNQVVNVTYQSSLAVSSLNQVWALNYQGKRIPIPTIGYQDLVVSGSPEDRFFALIGQLKGQRVLIAFSQMPNSIPGEGTEVNSEMSNLFGARETEMVMMQRLFGPDVRLFDVIKFGWEHQLSDLKCQATTAEADAPIAMALILKSVASPSVNETAVAYAFPQGQAMETKTETEQIWLSEWVTNNTVINQVTFRLPKNQDFGTLGLGPNDPNWIAAANAPVWLSTLETALNSPSPETWQALLAAMKTANFSPKSLESIQRLLDPGPS